MGRDANTDNPRGFMYEGRLSNNEMPTMEMLLTDAAYLVLKHGDPLAFNAGEIEEAATGSVIVGVAVGDPYLNDASAKVILVIAALPDVIFRVQDDVASPLLSSLGGTYDIDDTTNGAFTIDGKTAATYGDVVLIAVADADDMWMYNEGDEQYRDMLVIFKRTSWNGYGLALTDIDAALVVEAAQPKVIVSKVVADASAGLAFDGIVEGDEVIGVYVICSAANANGTLILETGADDDITDAMICAVDKTVVFAGTIDDAHAVLPATGAQVLSVGGTAANTRGIVVVTYIPVAV